MLKQSAGNVFHIGGSEVIHRQGASFEDFWALYPRRTAKGAAIKSWARLTQDARKEALEGLRGQVNYLRSIEWGFIPHPATWLNQMRWLDELPGVQKPSSTADTQPGQLRSAL